jgi:hypothetical protein
MTTMTITRDDTGKLTGAGEKDKKAYAAFRRKVEALEPGECYQLTVWFPRNQKLHGLHFALLAAVFDNQEQFADLDQLRMWLQVGAGHADFLPGPTGKMVAIPRSISFRAIDDQDFADHHEKVKDFLRSGHAKAFLWPHIKPQEQDAIVDSILAQFDGGNDERRMAV